MSEYVFESHVMPDGHLYCPKELVNNKQAKFRVIVTFQDLPKHASDAEIEASALQDASDDFLSEKELSYYLNLEDHA
ncbi:MAG: hypothetical protein ACE5I1_13405 [bacterium]